MSYNQSFVPQSGQGNLSSQFGNPRYQPLTGGSAPRDIPSRPRRHSSLSSGYSSYPPPPHAGSGRTPPGGYSGSSGMAYSPHTGQYATSPSHSMAPPPNSIPPYGASPTRRQSGSYGTSPTHTRHTAAGASPPRSGWQNPQYGPSSHQPSSYTATGLRRSSTGSHSGSHNSSDSSENKRKSKRRPSAPTRYDSPRRPTMTDSVMFALGGLKGAFDKRK